MANEAKRISQFPTATSVKTTDLVVIGVANNSNAAVYETRKATTATLFANVASNNLVVTKSDLPANNNANNLTVGQFWFANGHMYVVVANNKIQRAALSDY